MTSELVANYLSNGTQVTLGAAVLTAPVADTSETWSIIIPSNVVFPTIGAAAGQLRALIGTEIVRITAGVTTTGTRSLTVIRAQEDTTSATYGSGSVLYVDLTAATIANMVQLSPSAQQTGDANLSGTITAGTALSGPLNASNLTGSVALARLPTETDSTDTSSSHLVTSNDARLSDTRTPKTHASSHDPGGSDVLKDLTRLTGWAPLYGYITGTMDPAPMTGGFAPTAGAVFLVKLMTAHAYVVNNIDIYIFQGGTGVTALANCFIGLYDSGGTRRFASADQSSSWATAGNKSISLGGSAYTVTANDFIYIAVLIGTQSTTTCQVLTNTEQSSNLSSLNLTAATARFAQQLTGQTSLPSPSLTLSSNTLNNRPIWVAVK